MQVVDEADGLPVGEEGGDLVALTLADFECQQAVGFERGVGLGDEAAIDFQSVGAGEERGGGFVIADLRMERVAVRGGDVGWVGDDCVERLAGGQRFE